MIVFPLRDNILLRLEFILELYWTKKQFLVTNLTTIIIKQLYSDQKHAEDVGVSLNGRIFLEIVRSRGAADKIQISRR